MEVAQLAQGWLWKSFSPSRRDRIECDGLMDASNAQLRSSQMLMKYSQEVACG